MDLRRTEMHAGPAEGDGLAGVLDAPAEPLCVGVVNDGTAPIWIGVAETRAELVSCLAEFLLPRTEYQLHEDVFRQFRRLMDQGQEERAVELYFETSGERWDREHLTIVTRYRGHPGGRSPA